MYLLIQKKWKFCRPYTQFTIHPVILLDKLQTLSPSNKGNLTNLVTTFLSAPFPKLSPHKLLLQELGTA